MSRPALPVFSSILLQPCLLLYCRDCSEFALWPALAEAFLLSLGRCYFIKMKILLEFLILHWQNPDVIQNQDEAFGFSSVSCGDFITSFVLFYVMILFWCDLGAFGVCLCQCFRMDLHPPGPRCLLWETLKCVFLIQDKHKWQSCVATCFSLILVL